MEGGIERWKEGWRGGTRDREAEGGIERVS